MNRRSWKEIFASINDPEVPALFLIGTMVFAILGNALYDLLVELLQDVLGGENALLYAVITVFSAALLVAITLILWLWFNLRRRQRNRLADAVKLDRAYPGLIVFVSARQGGAEPAAIAPHLKAGKLRRLWLIATNEAEKKAAQLRDQVRQEANDAVQITIVPLDSAFDIPAAYRAVVQAFDQAGDLIDQVIVDITGGTKHMSAGAVLACREYGVPMQYVLAEIKDGKVDERSEGELMKVWL
ncbi:hypothetical protein A6A03_17565 [Chloroflexus islandicus]|uniref:Card1 CARF domain-containing protein n=1 Tax=Chloroflexus islandicus TaxID=1707952 RepID=A0A178M6P3_9CHLR|nr:hypothetical protein [Chloroflexus islandicus]OAN43897.1 hypothetical protein A6A03_17565 [Chloroflexus islandicus]